MATAETTSTPDIPTPLVTPVEILSGEVAIARRQLVGDMIDHGLISQAFAESGILNAFSIHEASGGDALQHFLIGDETGGGHHLPTIMALGAEGRQISSTLPDPQNPTRTYSKYRKDQRVRTNGTYHAKGVVITGSDGRLLKKEGGSMFFPNDWSTEDAIEAVVAVSMQPGEHNPDYRSYTHKGIVKGVKVRVHTDDLTRNIKTAAPA